jgi:hypothetical protein
MGDVPSQHLMRPVPSAGRRRQGHPAGERLLGLLANSAPVPGSALCYPFYKKLPLHAEDTQISDDRTQGNYPGSKYL